MGQRELVVVLTGNLFFLPRIEAAAEHFGLEVPSRSNSASALLQAAEYPHRFVGAGRPGGGRARLVGGDHRCQRVGEESDGTPLVVAYGPHGEPEVLRKARELGSDAVIIKRDFSERLPELLESRGWAFVR